MNRVTTQLLRALVALGLALAVATCRDAFSPGNPMRARVAVAPILPSVGELATFGLVIDAVRFVVVRPAADTLADTTLALAPDATELALDLHVAVVTSPETLSVSVVALSGTIPLFSGTQPVPVPGPATPTEIPVATYIGPTADSIVIQPRSPFVHLNDSLRFQVQGFNAGVAVTQFFVAWSTSDTTVARINHFGVLRGPAARASVRVRARTPSGASDSVIATFVPAATQLVAIAGGGQMAVVGAPLVTPLEVESRGSDGLAVGGVSVRFRALVGGGAVTDTVVVTDVAGRARTTVTLGSVVGAQSFEASATGLGGSPVTFNAVAFAGGATQLVATAGDLQSAVVGTAVVVDPAVRAEDQFGNPVPGASITFAVSGSGGSVTAPAQLTNGAGVATVGSWTLGTTVGTDTLTATLSSVTPVRFTAKALAGAASLIQAIVGGGETVTVNTAVTTAPAVRVTDQFGNAVAGASVTFAVASGGGSLGGPSVVATDTAGIARSPAWTIGTAVGANTLTATATGLTGSPITFTATGTAAVASLMVKFAGDGQAALPGTAVSINPAVRVTDQFGNPIAGVSVTFAVAPGSGSLGGPGGTVTDTGGVAMSPVWTLESVAGTNTLNATATGLPTVTFTAEGLASTATRIVRQAGDSQSAVVGTTLAAYSVLVTDDSLNPVANVPVSWAVTSGGGTIVPSQSMTNALGIATATRTLGTVAGTQTATASVGGLLGSPVVFSATALAGAASRLVKQSADPQTATVGASVIAPVVKVTDQFGNGVAGVIVGFAGTPAGNIGATADTTDGLGLATAASWSLGTVAGINTVTATSGGLSAVFFTATGVAGAPAQVAFFTQPGHSLAGDTIEPVQVAIQDQYGNIDFTAKNVVTLGLGPTPPDSAAKLLGTIDVAAVNGLAVFPDLSIDSAGFGYSLIASSAGLAGTESKPPFDVGGVIDAVTYDAWQPVAAAVNSVTGFVYVPGLNNGVGVLDPGKRQLIMVPGFEAPFGVAVDTVTNRIYVTTAQGVVVMDGRDNSRIATIPVGPNPRGIAVDEATNRIYVAVDGDPGKGEPPVIALIDGKDNTLLTTIPFPEGAVAGIGVAFNPDDRQVYVAVPNAGVAIFDPETAKYVATIPISGEKGAAGTYGVAVDVRARLVYATNRTDGTFSVLDPLGRKEIVKLRVGASPEGLGVDPDRGMAYVGNSGDGTVSFIDAGKLSVFATLIVGPTPKAAAVNLLTGQFFVPTFGDNQVRVVQP
jgi:adhesin/invasin